MIRLLALLLCVAFSASAPVNDLVEDLPGLEFPVSYKQYSGYLYGGKGRYLHYWFFESQKNAAKDPLVLWLNGGPGCSSLMGLLTENGPFSVSPDEPLTLVPNPYSWNKIANVLYLESPACVGFSYQSDNKCRTGDSDVVEQNFMALNDFYKKFPEYKSNNLYITGESYGGIYVPTLAKEFLKNSTNNYSLKGFAIGNGLLNYTSNDNSLLFFAYHHGLIGEDDWLNLMNSCCYTYSLIDAKNCSFDTRDEKCKATLRRVNLIIHNKSLNMYDLYGKCEHPTTNTYNYTPSRYNIDKRNMLRRFRNIDGGLLESDPPCTDNEKERYYLNHPKVKNALHISNSAPSWEVCNMKLNRFYHREVYSSTELVAYLQKNKIKGLIYNGDVDMACNFMGNEWEVDKLNLKRQESRRAWEVNNQIAGYVDRFQYLDFVTVKGSGHMVPKSKPAEALHMLDAFINGKEY